MVFVRYTQRFRLKREEQGIERSKGSFQSNNQEVSAAAAQRFKPKFSRLKKHRFGASVSYWLTCDRCFSLLLLSTSFSVALWEGGLCKSKEGFGYHFDGPKSIDQPRFWASPLISGRPRVESTSRSRKMLYFGRFITAAVCARKSLAPYLRGTRHTRPPVMDRSFSLNLWKRRELAIIWWRRRKKKNMDWWSRKSHAIISNKLPLIFSIMLKLLTLLAARKDFLNCPVMVFNTNC